MDNNNNNNENKKQQSLGVLWNKGNFFTGRLTPNREQVEKMLEQIEKKEAENSLYPNAELSIVVFNNKFKKASNHPDYNIYQSIPQQNGYKKNDIKNETDFSKVKTKGNTTTKHKKNDIEQLEDDDYDTENPQF